MATKIYVINPQIAVSGDPADVLFGWTNLEWTEGLPGIFHPPFNQDTLIHLVFTDNAGTIRQKIVDCILAVYPITASDIVFIPEIGAAV